MGAGLSLLSRAVGLADRSAAQGKIAGTRPDSAASRGPIEMKRMENKQNWSGCHAHIFCAHTRFLMRSRVAAVLLALVSGIFAHAQDDVALRAMKDELGRSIAELQL